MFLKFKKNLFLFTLVIFLFSGAVVARASNGLEINYQSQAFTASSVRLTITPSNNNNLPWEWQEISPAYYYSFTDFGFYDPSRPLELRIYYSGNNDKLKQIFSYDQLANIWRPLISHDYPRKKYVSAITTSVSGRVVLLSDPNIMTVGRASWYAYKHGNFAASPDLGKGSIVRVYNLDNGKAINVTINDWGPERDKFPQRVIDLDKVAFSQLASTRAGVINVKIEPQKIVVTKAKQKRPQTSAKLNISASAAIIVSEKDNRVLWSKNENKISPLASLSKLVAIEVFLNTRPSLNTVVSYKYQDEKYNAQACNCQPWEPVRLHLKTGETLTVKDLIYSSLVASANNAVETLVRVSGLSRPEFIQQMNNLVKEWGANSTHFIEPTGLSPSNVSSPRDYAIIAKRVLANPLIRKITTTVHYKFTTINTHKTHYLTNTDKLLQTSRYNIIGSKTGYLDEAGHCLMTMTKTKYGKLIVVNFDSKSKAENFLDNEQLIRYGEKLLQTKK